MTQDQPDDVDERWPKKVRVALLILGVLVAAIVAPMVLAQLQQGSGTPVSGDVAVGHAPDGPAVTTTGDLEIAFDEMFPDDNTVALNTTAGNATFESQGRTDVRVTSITGTTTDLDQLDVASNDLTVDPGDKPALTVGGGADSVSWRDPTVDDGVEDLSYAASSATTITMRGLPSDTGIKLIAESGTVLSTTTTDSGGAATFPDLPSGSYDAEIVTGDPPVLSDGQPADGATINDYSAELSIDLSDPDFAMPAGDNVTVTFRNADDGTQIGQSNVTSNGTITATWSGLQMGANEWNVTATDEYGNEASLGPFTVLTPAEVEIRDEETLELITGAEANVTATLFPDDNDQQIVRRTTNDGTVNLTGLPSDQEIYIQADANNYVSRTVIIRDITEQQTLYLLNESATAVESRFVLEDLTGQFPEESALYVSKPIQNGSETSYQVVHADQFGVDGVTANLEEGQRYRLRIVAPDGTQQDLGPYRAATSETVTVQPGTDEIDLSRGEEGWASGAYLDGASIYASYEDPTGETDSVEITIYERGNRSNQLAPSETYVDLGNVSTRWDLTANESDLEWVVMMEIDRRGESHTAEHVVGANPNGVIDGLSSPWRLVFGIGALLLFGGVFSVLNRAVGAVMVGLVGGILYWTGWLEGATAGVAVAIYLFIAIVYAAFVRSGP